MIACGWKSSRPQRSEPVRLAFQSDSENPARWKAALEAAIPHLDFCVWPEIGDPASVDVLLAYRLPPELHRLTGLKLLQLISAGTDQLAGTEGLPPGVPVARLIEPGQVAGMVEYVLQAVLHYHRDLHRYRSQQADRIWLEHPRVPASERTVGIMGLGALGRPVARAIGALGFDVSGWTRRSGGPSCMPIFTGRDSLPVFLARNDIVVALLPLARDTVRFFDDAFFGAMRHGSCFINVGRGAQLDPAALLRVLERGHLAGATLDVLPDEPPRRDDPIWDAPNLILTPHAATSPDPRSAALVIADSLARIAEGRAPLNAVET